MKKIFSLFAGFFLFLLTLQNASAQSFTHTKKEIDVWYARAPEGNKVIAITQGPFDHKVTEGSPMESGFYSLYVYDNCDESFDCTSNDSAYSKLRYATIHDVYFDKVLDEFPGQQLILIESDPYHGTRTSGYNAYIFDVSTPRSSGSQKTKIALVAMADSIDPEDKKDILEKLIRFDPAKAQSLS
jgi:hypothetical protein